MTQTSPNQPYKCCTQVLANRHIPQTWDVDGSRARPLPDPAAPDGHKRTRDGSRLLFDAKGAACGHCGCLAMTSPLSAVCSYCDAIMSGFR